MKLYIFLYYGGQIICLGEKIHGSLSNFHKFLFCFPLITKLCLLQGLVDNLNYLLYSFFQKCIQHHCHLHKGQSIEFFPLKGSEIFLKGLHSSKWFRCLGHMLSVAIIDSYHCSIKRGTDHRKMNGYNLFTKIGGEPGLVHGGS